MDSKLLRIGTFLVSNIIFLHSYRQSLLHFNQDDLFSLEALDDFLALLAYILAVIRCSVVQAFFNECTSAENFEVVYHSDYNAAYGVFFLLPLQLAMMLMYMLVIVISIAVAILAVRTIDIVVHGLDGLIKISAHG